MSLLLARSRHKTASAVRSLWGGKRTSSALRFDHNGHRPSPQQELTGPRDAVLEFRVEIDGIDVNGVDMIKWDDEGKIVEFKVLIRPLKAVNLIHQKMAAMLQAKQ
jgi:hypothetical protein